MKTIITLLIVLMVVGCTSIPDKVTPVTGFEIDRYLGTWYEIARMDHSFERGLDQVTATYSKRSDGGIDVLNKGFDVEKGEWKEAQGKAYFVSQSDVGHLKVSFFGPFYASYVIAELDKGGYQYALVTGPDTDYLWILARSPVLDTSVVEDLTELARGWGFDVDELIYVSHQ